MLTRSKVKGMVVGGAIGDAAGKPVETWTPEKILEVHPEGINVGKYLPPIGHKWFKEEEHPPGTTTDDEQLKTACMFGFMDGKDEAESTNQFDAYHKHIAMRFVSAYKESDAGWGNTTRDTIKSIANNCPWYKAGSELSHGGTGNGVPMRVAPWAAWYLSPGSAFFRDQDNFLFNHQIVRHAAMTHATDISAWAGVVHVAAVNYCLSNDPSSFSRADFLSLVAEHVFEWGEDKYKTHPEYYSLSDLRKHPTEESLEERMLWLFQNRDRIDEMERDELREKFGKGHCYVLHSLPFTYAYFLKSPTSPFSIIDVIEAGGDTDTNASMVGEMVGALCGIEAFEEVAHKWMIDGLKCYDRLIEMADRFCDTFGIEE